MHLDVSEVFIVAAITVLTFVSALIFRIFYFRFIKRNSRLIHNDPTRYKFLGYLIMALIYVVGFSWAVYRIEELRTIAKSLLAGAGILAVAVGFASQHALSNIISGLFIVIFKPYRINDRIILSNDRMGTVEDITLRHTVIRDLENRRIVIPNAIISDQTLTNMDLTDARIQRHIEIGISYDSDIPLAKAILREEVLNHPYHIDGRSQQQVDDGEEVVPVRVLNLGDFAVTIRAWAWAESIDKAFRMHCDVLESTKARFDREGIEIPFPYRTIVYKNDLIKKHEKES